MNLNYLTQSKSFTSICLFLALLLSLTSCTSYVVIAEPYPPRLRVGDGVKLLMKDGTIYSGRITYLDQGSVVIRTPKQTKAKRPVEVALFGITIPWSDVVQVKVSGTLDSQDKLISNEEIRVNRRTNHKRNMLTNVGLLGVTLSFFGASLMQDAVSPTKLSGGNTSHIKGRIAFWSTFILGSVTSGLLGYKIGQQMDRQVAITRIERFREQLRLISEARQDSLDQIQNAPIPQPQSPPTPVP